jgi:3-phosphoshikimate 1-carboxyvinyltransferase
MAIKGTLAFPGDKSISHRALMLASLAKGVSRIHNLSPGLDVSATKECLTACGIDFTQHADGMWTVHPNPLSDPLQPLDCRNSGTTTRLLLGLLAGQEIAATFTGDASLSQRPMKRVLKPLSEMGLHYKSQRDHLPVTIKKSPLKGIQYSPPVASAQVKSALLLAGLGAHGKTTVTETIPTRDHTEIMLRELGASITAHDHSISVAPLAGPLENFQLTVPGDPSSAAFFTAAAILVPESELTLKNVLLNPTRLGFYQALKSMGANIEFDHSRSQLGEPCGDLIVRYHSLQGITIKPETIPRLIDELPILSVIATQAEGTTHVEGAGELRVKESDRIDSICKNLTQMGAHITEHEDGFTIKGPTPLRGARIETSGDHRIAMAFSIAGLIASGTTTLDDTQCIAVSFPHFDTYLQSVTT